MLLGYARDSDSVRRLCFSFDGDVAYGDMIDTLRLFQRRVGVIKLNSLFLKHHENAVHLARQLGYRVWVDLKSYDTPTTVAAEVKQLRAMEVDIASIHISGGSEMIRHAVNSAGNPESQDGIVILGATVLTNIGQYELNEEMGIPGTVLEHVLHLAKIGAKNGVHGFICSGDEVNLLKYRFGLCYSYVTPGIRFAGRKDRIQKRAVTPYAAIANGSDLVVLGSELIQGGIEAVNRTLSEIEKALQHRRQ